MYIQNITCNSFYGSRQKYVYRSGTTTTAVKKDMKEEFYSNIDKYLDKTYNKKKYFSNLRNCIKDLKTLDSFTEAEKQYLDALVAVIDDVGSISKIPDEYLRTLMENLLAEKQAQ